MKAVASTAPALYHRDQPAWQIVEKLVADGYEVALVSTAGPHWAKGLWTCAVASGNRGAKAHADTAALAICRAALALLQHVIMAYGCLAAFLRFLVLVLGVLCVALLLVGFWLGAEQVAVWTLTTSPSTELNVNVWGRVPDLYVVVRWQDLARGTNTRLGSVSVRAWIVSVTTIALCVLAMVVDTWDPRQRRRS